MKCNLGACFLLERSNLGPTILFVLEQSHFCGLPLLSSLFCYITSPETCQIEGLKYLYKSLKLGNTQLVPINFKICICYFWREILRIVCFPLSPINNKLLYQGYGVAGSLMNISWAWGAQPFCSAAIIIPKNQPIS